MKIVKLTFVGDVILFSSFLLSLLFFNCKISRELIDIKLGPYVDSLGTLE